MWAHNRARYLVVDVRLPCNCRSPRNRLRDSLIESNVDHTQRSGFNRVWPRTVSDRVIIAICIMNIHRVVDIVSSPPQLESCPTYRQCPVRRFNRFAPPTSGCPRPPPSSWLPALEVAYDARGCGLQCTQSRSHIHPSVSRQSLNAVPV